MAQAIVVGYLDSTTGQFTSLCSSAGLAISSDLTLDPTNLATSAKQDTAQTSLTAIATALGTPADAAWTSGSGSVIAILKTIATNTTPAP